MQSMKSKVSNLFLVVTIISVLLLAGCQPPKPAALSEGQVTQATENILKAIHEGNYQNFVQDFSDQMKSAFPESEFTKLCDLLQNASGNYVSCSAPSLSNNQGYALYRSSCKFDKEDVLVTITIKFGGDKVEGLFFDSTNLRKLSK
jgi:hypothetical protein